MKKKLILPIILLIVFIMIMIFVMTNNITFFDDMVYNFLISKRSSGLDLYFTNITRLGNTITIIIAMITQPGRHFFNLSAEGHSKNCKFPFICIFLSCKDVIG